MYILENIVNGTESLPLQYTMIDILNLNDLFVTKVKITHRIPIYRDLYLEINVSEDINYLEVWSPFMNCGRNGLIDAQWLETDVIKTNINENTVVDMTAVTRKLHVSYYGNRFLGYYATSVVHYIEMHLERLYLIRYRILKDVQ